MVMLSSASSSALAHSRDDRVILTTQLVQFHVSYNTRPSATPQSRAACNVLLHKLSQGMS